MYSIYLISSIVLLFSIYRQNRNALSPLIIYISIWVFVVSLYTLKLIPYHDTLYITWLFIIFSPITMWLGYTSMHVILPNKIYSHRKNYGRKVELRFILYLFGLLVVVRALSVWLGIYAHYGSFSAAFTHGADIYNLSRSGQWAPGIGFYIPAEYISMFFVGIYHRINGKVDGMVFIILLSTLMIHIALQSRFTLLMTFSLYFAAYVSANGFYMKIKFITIFKYLSVGIFLIVLISLSRDLATNNAISGEWGDYGLTVLPSIYYYITNGIAGLNEYIRLGVDEHNTIYTLDPLLRFYSIFDTSIKVNIYESVTYNTPLPTIISTWLKFLIDDFGYIGTMLILYVIGVIIRYSEFILKQKISIFWISVYAHIFTLLLYSFFGYAFFIASFWYSFVVTSLIGLLMDGGILRNELSRYLKKKG
jgi:oligosaccharide repeat unit polymerase